MSNDDPTDVTFRRGDLMKDLTRFGIKVSKGVTVRAIAYAGRYVNLAAGTKSTLPFHSSPDGAAVFPLTNGGYVYVTNSEVTEKRGGVYGVYFDDAGNVVDYKQLLSGTTRNCSGGATPWKTYVSCEEFGSGQCYQVDPDPTSVHHFTPQMTALGGTKGGNFEAVVSFSLHSGAFCSYLLLNSVFITLNLTFQTVFFFFHRHAITGIHLDPSSL
jgi:hypothetical protein